MSLLQEERKCSTTRRFHSSFSNGRWIGGGLVVAVGFGFWLLFSFRFDTHYFLLQTLNLIKWHIIIIIYCVHLYLLLLLKQANALPFFSPNDNNFLNSCRILIIFLKPDYWTLITKRGFDIMSSNFITDFWQKVTMLSTWKEIGEDLNLRSPPHESLTLTDDSWSETRLLLSINK